jgi:heavy metal sensor kinase
MIHSFRWRLALLSAFISGLVLAVFGLVSLWLIHSLQVEKLDAELRARAERQVARIRDTDGWQFAAGLLSATESQLVLNMDMRNPQDLLLLVESEKKIPIFRSAHWPAVLNSDTFAWPKLSDMATIGPNVGAGATTSSSSVSVISQGGQSWRVGLAANDRVRIAIAINARVINTDMDAIRNAFLLALPLALVLIGAGSWFFAGRALGPVDKLTQAAHRITAEGLHYRLATKGEDLEFAELIDVFNQMLERLERSFNQAHRFSADAAHELKTPLAIVQGQLERAIDEAQDGSDMQANLASILDEVRRLTTISQKLLLLSQADAGKLAIASTPLDLSSMLEDLLEDTRMLAPHIPVSGDVHIGFVILGEASLLRQVLHNLISNAIKYNTTPGWIHFSTSHTAKEVQIHVTNASYGIPAALHARVFERFFRVDSAHSRTIEGVGLGLSVSREIARAHGGDLVMKADSSGVVQFTLVLPKAPPQSAAA